MPNQTELKLPTEKIRAHTDGATGHIVFNNPERHNAVSLEMWDAVEQARRSLADDGCAVIRGFLSRKGLEMLLGEALERQHQAYYSPNKKCNVYLGDCDPTLPPEHPRNVMMDRTNGFVTADLLDGDTASHALYYWEPLGKFLADCLGKNRLFIYEDPVSNMALFGTLIDYLSLPGDSVPSTSKSLRLLIEGSATDKNTDRVIFSFWDSDISPVSRFSPSIDLSAL